MQLPVGRLNTAHRALACALALIGLSVAAACSPDSPDVVSPAIADMSFQTLDLASGPVVAEIKSASAQTKCVSVRYWGAGVHTVLDPCTKSSSQEFQFAATGEIRLGSNYCIDVDNNQSRGDAVIIGNCNGSSAQKWTLTSAGEIRGINNYCVAYKGSPIDGTTLYITTCRGTDAQKWVTETNATTPEQPSPAPVASASVSLSAATIAVGQTAQATPVLKDASGNTLTDRAVAWSSSSPSVATVTAAGLITALAAGTTNIVLTSEGKTGSASITVSGSNPTPPPPPPPPGGLPAVPGLYGFGTNTPAGRGGQVIRVTNLNDAGTGSLRAALQTSGARVVIFDISGTITLSSKISVSSPYLTLAGQTAPAPGISLKGAGISIRTHDVLIQHLRFRTGVSGIGNNDGLEILGPGGYNIVADHISSAWAEDEDGSTWYSGAHDITFSNAIFSENLGSGSVLVGDSTKNFLIVNTLFAHNWDRNPYFKGNTTGGMANSVVYNWGGYQAFYTADPSNTGPSQVSAVGNVFIRGPSTQPGRPIQLYNTSKAGTKLYVAGNSEGRNGSAPADPWSLVRNDFGAAGVATAPPVWPAGLNAGSPSTVYNSVLGQAGAWPAARDAVDERVVGDVRNGTGKMPTAAGPWPTLPVVQRALTLPANPNGDDNGNGYTNLEEWLQGLARAAEGR